MATSDSPLSVPNITLAVARPAGGGSEPTGAPSISSVTDNGDGTLSISGSNFGSKAQSAPVLYDTVTSAYENGVENTFVGSLSDGATVPRNVDNSSSPYDTVTTNVVVNKTDRVRLPGGAHYRIDGNEGWIGYPMAYGGQQTPAGSDTLYVSWIMRRKWHYLYWRLGQGDMSGSFIVGEPITVNGIDGRYIGYDSPTDYYHFEIPRPNDNDLAGHVITGLTSGATMTFGSGGNGGFPGTKYMRLRDNQVTGGQSGSYTPADFYISPSLPRKYGALSIDQAPPDEWEMHELLIQYDFPAGTAVVTAWQNRILRGIIEHPDINPPDPDHSLTFSLLGNDAFETKQVTDIGFVYMDNTPQRVYLGNAPTLSACTQVELQRPTQWSGTGITAAKNEGTLTGDAWVYVAGPDGSINENGVAA